MIGIGVDVVEIERFRRSLERTPTMRERLFTSGELEALAQQIEEGHARIVQVDGTGSAVERYLNRQRHAQPPVR